MDHDRSAPARSSLCGHPPLWRPARLLRAALWSGPERGGLAAWLPKRGCSVACSGAGSKSPVPPPMAKVTACRHLHVGARPRHELRHAYAMHMPCICHARRREAIMSSLKRRATKLVAALNALEGVSCNAPQGSMYAFPKVTLPAKAQAAAAEAGKAADTFYALAPQHGSKCAPLTAPGFRCRASVGWRAPGSYGQLNTPSGRDQVTKRSATASAARASRVPSRRCHVTACAPLRRCSRRQASSSCLARASGRSRTRGTSARPSCRPRVTWIQSSPRWPPSTPTSWPSTAEDFGTATATPLLPFRAERLVLVRRPSLGRGGGHRPAVPSVPDEGCYIHTEI